MADTASTESGAESEPAESAEDIREYVHRVRSLPVEQVIEELLFSLVNAAQVKLGRRDARLLIDLAAVTHEHARLYLPDQLSKEIDQLLGQLRMAQVSAEGRASGRTEPEQNDLDRMPTPPTSGTAQPPADRPARKLWVPGDPL